MDDKQAVDQAALDRLKEWGGEKLMNQMVRLFLENSVKRMDQIRSGVGDSDVSEAEKGSHSLKSSAANVGAVQVSRVATELEAAAMRGDGEAVRDMLPGLEEAYAEARAALESIAEEQPE